MSFRIHCRAFYALAALAIACPHLHAAQNVTLRNGSEFLCTHQEPAGDRVRLYLYPTSQAEAAQPDANYLEVSVSSVVRVEIVPDPVLPAESVTPARAAKPLPQSGNTSTSVAPLTPAEMHQLLTRAGKEHNIDADLLASVVHAESGGNPRAVSRAGARGLMQLMPATAANLGVQNSFAPDQNVAGGTQYLDQLLTRYHDNLALALAAYNAGPEAVDRYHGIPPYAETRAYVAGIIREFNRRKLAARTLAATPPPASAVQTASIR
ncbi:MAG TPA: lytic transglycosylase domain-containing protein [Acidobacteriaceae bacterium]|nr:lytic transglycosylase domain-containing protein [Acidobacteriaceae bacterium]